MSVYEKAKGKRLNAPEWKKILVKELLKPKLKRFSLMHQRCIASQKAKRAQKKPHKKW